MYMGGFSIGPIVAGVTPDFSCFLDALQQFSIFFYYHATFDFPMTLLLWNPMSTPIYVMFLNSSQ